MKAERWPNSLGWNVKTNDGRLRFEVWPAGSVVRCVDDPDSLCGFRGTHYFERRTKIMPQDPVDAIALCWMLWKQRRTEWVPIEA
jgi:hypothetical protein